MIHFLIVLVKFRFMRMILFSFCFNTEVPYYSTLTTRLNSCLCVLSPPLLSLREKKKKKSISGDANKPQHPLLLNFHHYPAVPEAKPLNPDKSFHWLGLSCCSLLLWIYSVFLNYSCFLDLKAICSIKEESGHLPCRIKYFQRQRRCHKELCCQWTHPCSW